MNKVAVEARELGIRFRRAQDRRDSFVEVLVRGRSRRWEEFWALRNLNLSIPSGCFYGLVGPNGSGKSSLLKAINKIYTPHEGTIKTYGRVAALIELGAGFHPEMTGRENIRLNGAILGLNRNEISNATEEIIDFSGIREFINEPVKHYSSGMNARLGFSIAAHMSPDVLLIDEILSVGDLAFQTQCETRLADLRKRGTTVVLVSHSLAQVSAICDEAAWLEAGKLQISGSSDDVCAAYEANVEAPQV